MRFQKKLFALFAALCLLVSFLPSAVFAAESGECGENLTWEYNSTTGWLTIRGSGAMKDYTYRGDAPWYGISFSKVYITGSVESIGDYAFADCSSLLSVEMSNSVTRIGKNAFYDDKGLVGVNLSTGLKEIADDAFFNCEALYIESLELPSGLERIGRESFFGCGKIKKVTIPNSVQEIGNLAFSGCSSLSEITARYSQYFSSANGVLYNADKTKLYRYPPAKNGNDFTVPETVSVIGTGAFADCSNLQNIIYSPEQVNTIESRAFHNSGLTEATLYANIKYGGDVFWNCTKLQNVTVEEGVLEIPIGNYAGCAALQSIVLPDSVIMIAATAFSRCEALESVQLGEGVQSIDDWAFQQCTSLSKIVIPDSVHTVRPYAFQNCSAVAEIEIGSGLVELDRTAFRGAKSLQGFTVSPEQTSFAAVDGVLYSQDLSELIQYPAGAAQTAFTVPDAVRTIDSSAFENAENLLEISLNEGLCEIGEKAFSDSGFYKNRENWQEGALYLDRWLIEIFKDTQDCVVLPGTKRIANGAFPSMFSKLQTVSFPASIAQLESSSLSSCSSLCQIFVDSENPYYSAENGVLYDKNKTSLIYYPAKRGLTEFTVPDGVQEISSYAFRYASGLRKVLLPESVETIGTGAFYGCWGLSSVTIPAAVREISKDAFGLCYLSEIRYTGSRRQWSKVTVDEGNANLKNTAVTYIAPFTESTVTQQESGAEVIVLQNLIPAESSIYVAGYDRQGRMTGVKTVPVSAEEQTALIPGEVFAVRVFVWNENQTPYLAEPETIEKDEFQKSGNEA